MKNSKFNLTEIMNNRSVRRERDQIEGQITIQDWLEWKEDIRNRLQETSENFIVIGYRLKQMRESRMYEQEGFRSLSEFAQREYNLSRSVVSRLIQINDRFSEDGNSMELKAEYRNYGFAKLQEMLYLTDEELEEVTEDMTVREVREIRMEREQPEEEEPEGPKEGAGSAKEEKEVAASQQNDDDWKEKKAEPKPIEPPPRDAGISIRMIGFAESEARDIRRCLTALYSVRVGEQPLDRDFGLDWSCLDQPIPIAKNLLALEIIEKTRKYENRAAVDRVEFQTGKDGQLIPIVWLKRGDGA